MRKMKALWMLVAIAMMSFTFVSCDDDPWDEPRHDGPDRGWFNPGDDYQPTIADEADALCGEWYGPVRFIKVGDQPYEFYATMRFARYNNATSGSGTEIDYSYNEDGSVADTQTLTFTWQILNNFDIQINYDDGGTYILDYGASQKGFKIYYNNQSGKYIFSGYMIGDGDSEGNEIQFSLQAVNGNGSRAAGSSLIGKTFGSNEEEPVINVVAGGKLSAKR